MFCLGRAGIIDSRILFFHGEEEEGAKQPPQQETTNPAVDWIGGAPIPFQVIISTAAGIISIVLSTHKTTAEEAAENGDGERQRFVVVVDVDFWSERPHKRPPLAAGAAESDDAD